jgi:hypothetical protein
MYYLYLININNTDLYKIGITKRSPEKRLKTLQTGNPHSLRIQSYYKSDIANKIEKYFHRIYKYKQYNCDDFNNLFGEWFSLQPDDVLNFIPMCKKIETGIKIVNDRSNSLYRP